MPKSDPLPMGPLLALARLLAGPQHADRVAEEVALAATDADGYAARFEDRMDDRMISPQTSRLVWIALVDALDDAGRAIELDWKEDVAEVEAALDRLAGRPVFADTLPDDADTFDALKQAGRQALDANLALFHLDIDSDSYPVTLVPLPDAYPAQVLADQLGTGLFVPFSAVPPPLSP